MQPGTCGSIWLNEWCCCFDCVFSCLIRSIAWAHTNRQNCWAHSLARSVSFLLSPFSLLSMMGEERQVTGIDCVCVCVSELPTQCFVRENATGCVAELFQLDSILGCLTVQTGYRVRSNFYSHWIIRVLRLTDCEWDINYEYFMNQNDSPCTCTVNTENYVVASLHATELAGTFFPGTNFSSISFLFLLVS